jgi:hypothetical protein
MDLEDWLSPDYRDVSELASTGIMVGTRRKDTQASAKHRQLVPELRPL